MPTLLAFIPLVSGVKVTVKLVTPPGASMVRSMGGARRKGGSGEVRVPRGTGAGPRFLIPPGTPSEAGPTAPEPKSIVLRDSASCGATAVPRTGTVVGAKPVAAT